MARAKSKAIAIVDPASTSRVTAEQKPDPSLAGSSPITVKISKPSETTISPTADDATHEASTMLSPSSPIKTSISTPSSLDIYARAYVPEAFRIINRLRPLWHYETSNPKSIDYAGYVRSFGGQPYLQNRSSFAAARYSCLQRETAYFESEDFRQYEAQQSIANNYERYFECLIGREFAHHFVEHQMHCLYNQRLYPYTGSEVLYTLTWPGILEDTPFIQAGDSIQLRQLEPLDESTRLLLMKDWIKNVGRSHLDNGRREAPNPLPPGWNGSAIMVRVHTVIKAQELVIIYAPGLVGHMEFNVILPVEQQSYRSYLNATAHFGRILNTNSYSQCTPNIIQQTEHECWARRMLFPTPEHGKLQDKLDSWSTKRKWFDANLNFEQQKAITSICNKNYGIVPYLISGPPGTGKTKVLVEAALQLIQQPSSSHILVCAPSNAAADMLVDRLRQHLDNQELLRLNAPTRHIAEVPEKLRQYCRIDDDGMFALPDFRSMMIFKIVVCSCHDASILVDACITNTDIAQFEDSIVSAIHPTLLLESRPLHWGALLLDEAAQAMEPEANIPLSVISPPTTYSPDLQPILVMAGDEYQLGPRTYSHQARLKTTLFTRLFQRPLYCDHPLARKNRLTLARYMLPMIRPPFTNLFRNYRSHPVILAVPSYSFYQDTLLTNGDKIDSLEDLDIWRGRKWPMLYVPNKSDEDLDGDGGGWYNRGEASKAVAMAQQVLASGLIDEKDICIMSPFAAQVRLLRKLCRSNSLWHINIGPCEAFQGLESRFVILCTTRARERFLDRDIAVCKGIICQPQRMNVSLTRAQHGLVVIGNAKLLAIDPQWSRFLSFCHRNGLVDGDVKVKHAHTETLRLESVLMAQDRDAQLEIEVTARQLGVYTEDDVQWALGAIAEGIVRQEEEDEEQDEEENVEQRDQVAD